MIDETLWPMLDPAQRYLSYRQACNWISFKRASDQDLAEKALKDGCDMAWYKQNPSCSPREMVSAPAHTTDGPSLIFFTNEDMSDSIKPSLATCVLEVTDFSLEEIDRRVKLSRRAREQFELALTELFEAIHLNQIQVRQPPRIFPYQSVASPDRVLEDQIGPVQHGWFLRADLERLWPEPNKDTARSTTIPKGSLNRHWTMFVDEMSAIDRIPPKSECRARIEEQFAGFTFTKAALNELFANPPTLPAWRKTGRRKKLP